MVGVCLLLCCVLFVGFVAVCVCLGCFEMTMVGLGLVVIRFVVG